LGEDEVALGRDDRWLEIRPEELLEMSEDQAPYGAVVECFTKEDKKGYQALEMADPEGVRLTDYRRGEIETIKTHLETSDLVVVIGPSTAGKTETILFGEKPYFPPENTLVGGSREKIIYLPLYLFQKAGVEVLQERLIEDCQRDGVSLEQKELILCDEFTAKHQAVELVSHLRSLGKKVVLAMGGPRTNKLN